MALARYAQTDVGVSYPPHYRSILEALEMAGCSITLVRSPSRMFVFRELGKSLLLVSPRAALDLAKARPDLILVLEYNMGLLWALLAARLTGAKLYVFQENAGYAGYALGGVRRAVRRRLASLIDGFLANTTAAADEIERTLSVDPVRVIQAPLLYPPAREEMLRRPFELADPTMRPLFLFVGRLDARKNVHTLLQASSILAQRGLDFSVWIVGDGPLRQQHLRTTRDLRLEDRVRFLPWIPSESLGFIYEKSDVFVMPSVRDYRSVSVLEAMRFGKPVLDSRSDGNAGDSVREAITGFLFDPRQPSELAQHMVSFVREPQLAARMGERANEMMNREYAPEVAADRLRRELVDPWRIA